MKFRIFSTLFLSFGLFLSSICLATFSPASITTLSGVVDIPGFGGMGGLPYTDQLCPDGTAITSLAANPSVNSGDYNRLFIVTCSSINPDGSVGSAVSTVTTPRPTDGGASTSVSCPPNQVATGLVVYTGGSSFDEGFALQCGKSDGSQTLGTSGVTFNPGGSGLLSGCPAGAVMVGFFGRAGGGTDTTGAACGHPTGWASATPLPGLSPIFGTPSPTSGGFTVQVTNYDSNYTWSVSPNCTCGSFSINGSGLVTATNVTPLSTVGISVTATRSGYSPGSATINATAGGSPGLTPIFGAPSPTSGGFTVQVTNYDSNYTWSAFFQNCACGSVSINSSGLVTATNVTPLSTTGITVTATRAGYSPGSATINATAGAAAVQTDSTPPVIVVGSGHIASPSITGQIVSLPGVGNVTDGITTGSKVTLTFNATDNVGITSVYVSADSSNVDNITGSALSGMSGPATLISGNAQSGTYSFTGTYPVPTSGNGCGQTTARAYAVDAAGNRSPITTIYRIDVVAGCAPISASPSVSSLPSLPAPSTIGINYPTQIVLSSPYNANGASLAGFTVNVVTVTSAGVPVSTLPYTGNQVYITGLTPGSQYSVVMVFTDSTGAKKTSAVLSANTSPATLQPQSITFNTLPSTLKVGDVTTSISLSGKLGTGLTSFSSSTPTVCSFINGTITALAAGTCSVGASVSADSTYASASVSGSIPVTVATSAPTATLTPPSGASSISSSFTLTGTGAIGSANSASISYACLTLDGSAYKAWNTTGSATGYGSYGPNSSCYSTSGSNPNFSWQFDPTSWTNGTHTFTLYVIDSTGKSSPTVSTTVTVLVPLPSATLVLPSGSNALSGKFTLSGAGQSASGTNTYLNYACLTLDGSSSISGVMSTSGLYGGGYGNSGSCWNLSSRGTSANFSWNIDATNWTVGTHTFSLTVIDASGKQSPVSAGSVTIFNPLPTISFTNLTSGQTIKGKVKVSVSFGFSGNTSLSIRNIGISASNANPEFSSYYTYSSNLGSGINVYAAPSAGTATWDVDTTRLPIGRYDLRVGVEDSQGRTSFAELSLQVARPAPAISITSPSENSSIPGDLNIRLHVTPDSESQANIVAIGVDNKNLTPTFAGSSYYSNNSFPVGYANWGVNDLRDFSFSESAKLLSPGPLTLHFIVLDSDGYSTSSTLNLQVVSSNPIITAPTTSSDAVQISPFSYSINVQAASGSGAVIQYVGILENGAVPLTPGVPAQVQNEQLPSGVSLYSVSNGNSFGWTLNPKNWASGLHTISVYAIDSNGRVGTANTTYYVAPKATWKLTQREPAILGKSVLTSVAMSTDNNWRQDPPVVVQVQTGPSSTGPWTTLNPLTLDSTGAGGFRVTMENSALWVRVLHDVQDSVQTGFSAPIELLTVADTGSRGLTAQNGTRLVNPDGTTPKVVCQLAKGVGQLSCSASNVESSTQPISLQVLSGKQWNPVKSISLSNIKSISLPSPVRVKGKAVKSSYRLVGAGTDNNQNAFIPWTSNILQA